MSETRHKVSNTYRAHGHHNGSCACCSAARHQNTQRHWASCSHCQEAARQVTRIGCSAQPQKVFALSP